MRDTLQQKPRPNSPTPVPVRPKARTSGPGTDAGIEHDLGNMTLHSRAVGLQTKSWVSSPTDNDEKEADQVAGKVMRMAAPGGEKACACGGSCPNCSGQQNKDDQVHTKRKSNSTGGTRQADPGPSSAPSLVKEVISSPGQSLDSGTRSFFESRTGHDFGQVRIHNDAKAGRSAGAVNALAYTVGKDVVFGPGQYNPTSPSGKWLLAHELAHVMQQRGGGPLQRKEKGVNPLPGRPLSLKWDIQFQHDKPGPAEMGAIPSAVLTASGSTWLEKVRTSLQNSTDQQAELEGNASIEGSADHNYELSVRRVQYIARLIGAGRVGDLPGEEHTCPKVGPGLYACGSTKAKSKLDPADRRVQMAVFTPPADNKVPVPIPVPVPTKETAPSTSWQKGIGGAYAYTRHHYFGHRGSNPKGENQLQLSGGATKQYHGKNEAGSELGPVVQLQYSLKTNALSISGGPQGAYVIPLVNDKLQIGAIAQVLFGFPLAGSSSGLQIQPVVGMQLQWTPEDWLQITGQFTGGLTAQENGPTTFDYGPTVQLSVVW
jgi:Domain of unknown function (DUF4157)